MKDHPTAPHYIPSLGTMVALWNRTLSNTTGISVYTCLFIIATDSQTSSCRTAKIFDGFSQLVLQIKLYDGEKGTEDLPPCIEEALQISVAIKVRISSYLH